MTLKNLIINSLLLFTSVIESTPNKDINYWNNKVPTIQDTSLLFNGWSINSQFGEEGIIDEILKRLNLDDGIFIEFSAFYNDYISNVKFLAERGWEGVFVNTGNDRLYHTRIKNCYTRPVSPILCQEEIFYFNDFANLPQVQSINDSESFTEKSFEQIIDSYFQNKEIDVLSIDVGGLDYLIFEKLQTKPKVIILKSGVLWSPIMKEKIPDKIAICGINQPMTALINSAKMQGFTPVCYTGSLIFIRNDYLYLFENIKKDPLFLWMDFWYYYSENQPSYISWIIKNKNSNEYIHKYDTHLLPNFLKTINLDLNEKKFIFAIE